MYSIVKRSRTIIMSKQSNKHTTIRGAHFFQIHIISPTKIQINSLLLEPSHHIHTFSLELPHTSTPKNSIK